MSNEWFMMMQYISIHQGDFSIDKQKNNESFYLLRNL